MKRTPSSALAIITAVLLAGFIIPNPPTAYAETAPTSLTIDYQTLTAGPGERVTLQGSLAFGDRPAPAGVPVDITLDGEQVLATVPSGEGGTITGDFVVPDDLRPGQRELLAMVEGNDTNEPAVQGSILEVTEKRTGTTLTAQLAAIGPVNQGDQLTLSGQITRADGKPSGVLTVSAVGGAASESLGSIDTDDQGRYQLSAQIPADAGQGAEFPDYPVRVTFSGNDDLAGSEQAITLTLCQQPAPQAEAESVPPETAQPDTAPPPVEESAVALPPQDQPPVTLVPLWMIIVGGAGFIALIGAAMIAHRRRPDENARLLP